MVAFCGRAYVALQGPRPVDQKKTQNPPEPTATTVSLTQYLVVVDWRPHPPFISIRTILDAATTAAFVPHLICLPCPHWCPPAAHIYPRTPTCDATRVFVWSRLESSTRTAGIAVSFSLQRQLRLFPLLRLQLAPFPSFLITRYDHQTPPTARAIRSSWAHGPPFLLSNPTFSSPRSSTRDSRFSTVALRLALPKPCRVDIRQNTRSWPGYRAQPTQT